MLFELKASGHVVYAMAGHTQLLGRQGFAAEVFMMLPASGHVNTGPMMLNYAKDTQRNWPLLKTETQLMVELTEKENCIWDMAELSCKVVGLCMRAVLESKPISKDHLRQLELEFLQQRALMKLLKPKAKKFQCQ